ncbi:uncharacterized protein [Littorina saxatilis]|uniref:SH2 domain-containing protein n=2 Tax=Littorina saxatilis TaxID=31220 RepID=A0AAN9GEQ2_9CAEN
MLSWKISVYLITFVFASTAAEAWEAGDHTKCTTTSAVVGGRGSMTFYFRQNVDLSLESFFAYVQREDDPGNVLECDRKAKAPGITCTVLNSAFQSTGISVNRTLTLTVPNVTTDLEGTYTMRTVANDTWEKPGKCTFTVTSILNNDMEDEGGKQDGEDKDGLNLTQIIVSVVCNVIIIAVAVTVAVYCLRRHRRRRRKGANNVEDSPGDEGDGTGEGSGEATEPLLKESWYHGKIRQKKARELLKEQGIDGSFLVRASMSDPTRFQCPCTDQACYILDVYIDGRVSEWRICKTDDDAFKFIKEVEDELSFPSLPRLVEEYQENNLCINGVRLGTLTQPLDRQDNMQSLNGSTTL